MSKTELERLRQTIGEGNELLRKARLGALESTIAIDDMLSAIIAEYFASDDSKRDILFEVLSFLTTYEKIEVFSILERPKAIQFGNRYKRIIQQLRLLNTYRNYMVHGFPALSYNPKLWVGRGTLRPFPINRRLVRKMEKIGETTYDSLSNIFKGMVDDRRKRKSPRERP